MKNNFGLVTGAAGFLGICHCEALIENNYNLILLDINQKKLSDLKHQLSKKYQNTKIIISKTDLSNTSQINSFYNKINKKNISVEVLINNACINHSLNQNNKKQSINTKSDNWDLELVVGLKSSYLLIELFSQNMIKKKSGVIINIASDLSVIAPNQSIYKKSYPNFIKPPTYSIIKHGLIGLTKYYASTLGKNNISCNAISPAGIENNQDKEFKKELLKLIPMNKMASKQNIISVVSFLINKNSRFVNGQNIIVDGGRTII
jgi:NAD(P)-dependent dehydrogenase (short-subunit alcohol dehydrogenase family)